ncbi:MAG TPA: LamG-like jellyroll fold domain-containing protein [Solirubrobacteraceae bacterium]
MNVGGQRVVVPAWLVAGLMLLVAAGPARAATAPTAYVANANANSLTPFDTVTNVAGTAVSAGSGPVAIAITPDGTSAYVANAGGNSVSVVDTATRTVTATIPVGNTPFGVAITPDGTRAYVSNLRGNSVSVIDTTTNAVVATVPVGLFPEGIAVTPDGARAYVVDDADNSVGVIDTTTNAVVGTIAVGNGPTAIAVTPDGKTAYVANGSDKTVTPIDLATNHAGATIAAGQDPFDVAITPDGTKAYIANFVGGTVTAIDVATGTPTATISSPSLVTPTALAVTPDGTTLEVTDFNANATTPVSTLTNAVGTPITGFAGPEGLAIMPDQPPHAAFTPTAAAAGQASSFDASASTDLDGSVASYAWDFGDASSPVTTTSATTTHTYASSGPFNVKLTETDDAGCSTSVIFTGKTASCNGSSVATTSQLVNVPSPPPSYAATVLASSPVGYWRMGEPSGTVMTDSSGNHNNGTYLGGVTLAVPGALASDPNTAASFDGVNDSARVPDSASLHTGATFTLEAWIKRSSSAKSYELLNKGANGYQLTVMSAASGSRVFLRKADVTTIAQSSAPVPLNGAYHFVAATMSGAGTARIYIDGVDVTQPVAGGGVQAIASTTQPVNIGGGGSAEAKYDELAVFGTALTAAQILAQDQAAAT